jgi:hypothetical protein
MPSSTDPCTWFKALLGFTIWLPTSAAIHTLSTWTAPWLSTLALTTSAK